MTRTRSCTNCGKLFSKRKHTCPKCGRVVEDNWAFEGGRVIE